MGVTWTPWQGQRRQGLVVPCTACWASTAAAQRRPSATLSAAASTPWIQASARRSSLPHRGLEELPRGACAQKHYTQYLVKGPQSNRNTREKLRERHATRNAFETPSKRCRKKHRNTRGTPSEHRVTRGLDELPRGALRAELRDEQVQARQALLRHGQQHGQRRGPRGTTAFMRLPMRL